MSRPYLLQHLLRLAADRTPEAVAVELDDHSLAYGPLLELSASLAATLIELGLRPGERVGLLQPRAASALVSMYGTLLASGVYVPLDLDAPDARHARILADCEISYLLVAPGSVERGLALAAACGSVRKVLEVGDDRALPGTGIGGSAIPVGSSGAGPVDWAAIRQMPGRLDRVRQPSECHLAYILYTSGSTGAPKGVAISHRNALSFVEWGADTFAVQARDRLVNTASLQFDLSVFDIYVAAAAGAALLPVPKQTALFPSAFAQWMADRQATMVYAVPSLLARLAERGNLGAKDLGALRTVLFAGEVFPARPLAQLVSLLPGASFYNLYGPTETNVITFHQITAADLATGRPPPIGRPCANCEVMLLDESGREVTRPGEEGEVIARGPTVAMRYWNEEARGLRLRAASEVPMYRTGDYAVWDAAGQLVFHGRRDHMVKCHGYRIELGEVEAALTSHPAVLEATVVAVPDDKIGNRLLAFVIPATDGTAVALKEHCASRLPPYMCPASIELVDSLPRGLTGKVDRNALLTRQLGEP